MDDSTQLGPTRSARRLRILWLLVACAAAVYLLLAVTRFAAGVLSLSEADRFDRHSSVGGMLKESLLWWDHDSDPGDGDDFDSYLSLAR